MTDYYTKGETRRLVGEQGLVRLGDPDKVEQRADGNIAKLYAAERVKVIVAELDAEREQAQIAEAARLDRVRRFGTDWEKLEVGLLVDLDLHFGGGWRFAYKGDWWHGYFQLYQGDELLMDGHDEFYEAIEYLVFNALADNQRERVWLYPPMSHAVIYDYQIGDWELVVALARECEPRQPAEAARLRQLARRYPVPAFEIEHDCADLEVCDWYIQHRDGFRATGYQDDDSYDIARLRALLEIAAYEDPTP
jgi:hypothetical protein